MITFYFYYNKFYSLYSNFRRFYLVFFYFSVFLNYFISLLDPGNIPKPFSQTDTPQTLRYFVSLISLIYIFTASNTPLFEYPPAKYYTSLIATCNENENYNAALRIWNCFLTMFHYQNMFQPNIRSSLQLQGMSMKLTMQRWEFGTVFVPIIYQLVE